MLKIRDINVREIVRLQPPKVYLQKLPANKEIRRVVLEARRQIVEILSGQDKRLLIIVGPCSIHDIKAGLEYAELLTSVAKKFKDKLLIVMRSYFEKPRTTIGWMGLIPDPDLNETFESGKGLYIAREFLLKIVGMGLPAATEFVDPITPQYIADLISWAAIGARTSESSAHRRMASGLSMPVGFKNSTSGDVQVAINGIVAAKSPQSFLGIDLRGRSSVVITKGNPYGHLILRGGSSGPNYDSKSVAEAIVRLTTSGLPPQLIVDCSHGNSGKDIKRQSSAFREVISQRLRGNTNIVGLMMESNLFPGNQALNNGKPAELKYGVSVTDPCIGWDETLELVTETYNSL